MTPVQEERLTVPEAARRLGMSVEALLDVIYSGDVPAKLETETGRLLLDHRDVDRLRAEPRSRHPS